MQTFYRRVINFHCFFIIIFFMIRAFDSPSVTQNEFFCVELIKKNYNIIKKIHEACEIELRPLYFNF